MIWTCTKRRSGFWKSNVSTRSKGCATESALDTKIIQVKNQLEHGTAIVVFNDKTETTGILLADDPGLKKLDTA